MGDPAAAGDHKHLIRQVDQHDFDLAAIPGIDQPRTVDNRDPVSCRKAASWRDKTCVALGDRNRDPRRDHRPLPRSEFCCVTRAQVHAPIPRVGVRRQREPIIEALEGDLHSFLPGSLRWDGIAHGDAMMWQLSGHGQYLLHNRSIGPMAKKDQEPLLPGNDGRWFLEAAGVVEQPGSPTSSYSVLRDLKPPAPVVASESAAVTASTAAVSGSLSAEEDADEDTFVPVAAQSNDSLPDWEPDAVSSRLGGRGYGRWVVAGIVIAVIAAVGFAAYYFPRAVQEDADALAATYRTSLTTLRNELPTTQVALQVLTDPATSPEDVSNTVPAIGDLNTDATIIIRQATAPLPSTPPLVPRTPLEDLEPTRSTMLILGADGEGISGRLATTFAYRSTVPALFDTPELPTQAESSTVDKLSVALAESLAETARLISDLPPDPTFSGTRELATEASARYATWQLEYLDALREGDTARATSLIAELDGVRDGIENSLSVALATVRAEVDPKIVNLATETEAAVAALP